MELKKIFALFAILFIACSTLNVIEPTNALSHKNGYLIDHGTQYTNEFMDGSHTEKAIWKTYWYSKNKRKIVRTFYGNETNKWTPYFKDTITLQKVSKTKMKINVKFRGGEFTHYVKTKLSTRDFYWKKVRPNIGWYV